jgi:hypothetical protein
LPIDPPWYSPGLAAADSWLSAELKRVLKGKRFSDFEDNGSSVGKKSLTDIPVRDFKNCFEQLLLLSEHYKEFEGEYFEKKNC